MDVSEQEILDQCEDWEVRARALIKVSDYTLVVYFFFFLTPSQCVERPSRWALHSIRPLPHYVDGRVALLGDAVSPILGCGKPSSG
jgi:salicylate hydroxylase